MLVIKDFGTEHIDEAIRIALQNYNAERAVVSVLPQIDLLPSLKHFADNGLGTVCFEGAQMLGFLCCYEPWDNAFGSTAMGTFSPVHAHGVIGQNRSMVYKRLYQAAAQKWVDAKIAYHGIGLYAHDADAVNSFFTYGFGMRCIDAIRDMQPVCDMQCKHICFEEIAKAEETQLRSMRLQLSQHLGCSPCFMCSSPQDFTNWLARAEHRNSRVSIAKCDERPIAFIEVMDSGENFATDSPDMMNICGAFCLPEYRGADVFSGLLNHTVKTLRDEGYSRLGVDFESYNPTAIGFWMKYFTAYTNSVFRRIDEKALCV